MGEIKLSDDVIEQIKDLDHDNLTEEQNSLINKLILNEELKCCYEWYGLCKECKQPNTGRYKNFYLFWCQSCNAEHFKQNFKDWTSGNNSIDNFIQKAQLEAKNDRKVLEWIEYDRFGDIEYLAKGGFGTTYKAIWKSGYIIGWDSENNQWKRIGYDIKVALKCLHNSQDITDESLEEIKSHILMNNSDFVVQYYGITKNLETNDFMIVMYHVDNGSLRQHLNNNFNLMKWWEKLIILERMASALNDIHNNGLIHRDFHCRNVLNHSNGTIFITDLGLCRPANVKPSQGDNKKIYGVLPYVAPEVLREKEYTQESDIYGFGIITYEVCTGFPPYYNIAHDEFLAIKICQGLRPKSNYKVPKLILDITNQCLDANPLKRPKAKELYGSYSKLFNDVYKEDSVITKQIKEANEINEKSSSLSYTGSLTYTTNPQAVYASRLLDFKNLPEPNNVIDYDNIETEYSDKSNYD